VGSEMCIRDRYSGGAQKAFLESTLEAARASNDIDWIVVVMHQVAISTAIPFNGCELGVRQEWLPLFDKYGVDLVVTGHEHHYERSFALRGQEGQYSRPVAASNETDTIDTRAGTVHMVLGGGGHSSSSHNKYSINSGAFEAEILAPSGAPPATPGGPIPLITPKPKKPRMLKTSTSMPHVCRWLGFTRSSTADTVTMMPQTRPKTAIAPTKPAARLPGLPV